MKNIIFFDWDGTLADSMDLCVAEVRKSLLSLGLPDRPDEVLRLCNGPSIQQSVPLLGIPEEMAQLYYETRIAAEVELAPSISRPYPGAVELVKELSKHALLFVVSNGSQPYVETSISAFGLTDAFCKVVCYREGRTKADNIRDLMAEHPGIPAVMVGDMAGDILAGKTCGLPTIAAGYGYGKDGECREADVQVASVEELKNALLDFCSRAG